MNRLCLQPWKRKWSDWHSPCLIDQLAAWFQMPYFLKLVMGTDKKISQRNQLSLSLARGLNRGTGPDSGQNFAHISTLCLVSLHKEATTLCCWWLSLVSPCFIMVWRLLQGVPGSMKKAKALIWSLNPRKADSVQSWRKEPFRSMRNVLDLLQSYTSSGQIGMNTTKVLIAQLWPRPLPTRSKARLQLKPQRCYSVIIDIRGKSWATNIESQLRCPGVSKGKQE